MNNPPRPLAKNHRKQTFLGLPKDVDPYRCVRCGRTITLKPCLICATPELLDLKIPTPWIPKVLDDIPTNR